MHTASRIKPVYAPVNKYWTPKHVKLIVWRIINKRLFLTWNEEQNVIKATNPIMLTAIPVGFEKSKPKSKKYFKNLKNINIWKNN